MMQVLSCRFQQCLVLFAMLLVEGSCATGPFRYLSEQVFSSPYFREYISFEGLFFFKMLKIWSRYQKFDLDIRLFICFSDICIGIGCIKLSLLTRKYLSSVVNLLTNSPKIFYITKTDFSRLNLTHNDQ